MKITIDMHGMTVLINGITKVGGGALKYVDSVLERCIKNDLWPEWIRQISYSDHSLELLAALGHPYSTRYGKDSFVHLDSVVHIQDGELLGGSEILRTKTGWELANSTPQYVYLRYGTSVMRMRDPGTAALTAALPAIRRRFASEIKGAIIQMIVR